MNEPVTGRLPTASAAQTRRTPASDLPPSEAAAEPGARRDWLPRLHAAATWPMRSLVGLARDLGRAAVELTGPWTGEAEPRAAVSLWANIARAARELRLTSVPQLGLEADDTPDRRRLLGSVQAVRASVTNVLSLAQRVLEPHTVALFWLEPGQRRLRLKAYRSTSPWLVDGPFELGDGLFGAITKRGRPVLLNELKGPHPGLVYYSHALGVRHFVGVPVLDGEQLWGVLLADRLGGPPFEERDAGVLATIAAEVVRAVQVEQIVVAMDREKEQKERFYQASREFNAARSVERRHQGDRPGHHDAGQQFVAVAGGDLVHVEAHFG